MATSFCHPIASPIRLTSARETPKLFSASSSGGSCLSQGCSARTSPASRARFRAFQPRTLLGPSSEERNQRSVHCGAVRTIGESEFDGEVLQSNVPVLVDFVADWCGPCRLISSIVEWASQEYSDRLKVVKIDHDSNPKLIEEYKVYGLPTLILFKNGQDVPESRREGVITKIKLKEYLDSLLGSPTVV